MISRIEELAEAIGDDDLPTLVQIDEMLAELQAHHRDATRLIDNLLAYRTLRAELDQLP